MARILIVVTHLLGAGHLARAAAIARASGRRGDRVTLVTGGMPMPLIAAPGIACVQLPPLRATAEDLGTPRMPDGRPADGAHLAARRDLLLNTLDAVRPDILVTELYPFGRRALAAEFDALIAAAGAMRPRPALACSIRDILVAPDRAAKIARTHALLAAHYDAVLVHADPALVRLEESWPADATLASRIAYTGYVDADEDGPTAAVPRDRTIVVSGGSSAAGLPLYRASLDAARRRPGLCFHVLVGHGIDDGAWTRLAREAGPNAVVERARPDFRALLRRSALLVGQSGYNTATDVLATGIRALFVPFERGQETEQRIRAERFAAHGLASVLPEADLDGPALASAIDAALAAPAPAGARIDRGGAHRSADILASLAGAPRTGHPAVAGSAR